MAGAMEATMGESSWKATRKKPTGPMEAARAAVLMVTTAVNKAKQMGAKEAAQMVMVAT